MKFSFSILLVFLFSLSLAMGALVNVGSGSNANIVVDSTGSNIVIGYVPACDNGWLDSGEDCDLNRMGDYSGKTCEDLFDNKEGSLGCYPAGHSQECQINYEDCTAKDNGGSNDDGSNDGSDGGSGGGSSGGGGSSSSCVPLWLCTSWDTCTDATQNRVCSDQNECGTDYLKPSTSRTCSVEGASGDAGVGLNETSGDFNSLFTGAFLGQSGQVWTGIGVFALIVILGGVAYWLFNRN